ncbi:MAG: peptidyl-prolyl cis-trans isomerase [Polyangiaceae bacterium]
MRAKALVLSVCLMTSAAAAAGDDDAVVLRVQDQSVSASEASRRLAALSPAQLAALGTKPQEIAKKFLESELALELAASIEAKQRGLDKTPAFQTRERVALRLGLDAALKAEALAQRPIPAEDIKAYFEANKSRFEQAPGVRLWRILVDDEAKAKQLIEQVKGGGSPAKWAELARENSVDKATNLRQGDLGFVHADGGTDVPRVRVDAALFQAAQSVKDGEVVPQPVREGAKFAVLWRRGSRPEKSRSLEQERDSIRALLERQSADKARVALLAELRQKSVRDEHPELLDQLPEGLFGSKLARPRPQLAGPGAGARGLKVPAPSDRGLR